MPSASCWRRLRAGLAAAAMLASAAAVAQSHGSSVAPLTAKDFAPPPALLLPATSAATELHVPPPDAAAIASVKRANATTAMKRVQIGIGRQAATLEGAGSEALRWSPVAGGMAARWRVSSAGAAALRVGLMGSGLPAGTEVRFAGDGAPETVYGPFAWSAVASAGAAYWSPVLEGATATVEVFVPVSAKRDAMSLSVAYVSHLFVSPAAPDAESMAKASGLCEVDFVCRAAGDAALAFAGRAVARMTFGDGTGGANNFLCTGTLLNATDNASGPYFYSANHCISTQASASTLTTHWFYENSTCGGGSISPSYVQVSGGATLLYADSASDVLLLRLNNSPPAGAVYAGWNATTLSGSPALTAIHHPSGDPKKVSLGTFGGFGTSSIPATPGGSFIIVRWNSTATGVTEGGSSGSGIFSDSNPYTFRGGLLGGPSSCQASSSSLFDYYSRLDLAYPRISQYLNPSTSGGCTYTLSASSASVGSGATSGSFAVTAGGSCGWSATSDASWLVTSSSGAGNGTVSYSVAANASTASRTGTISVGGRTFTVTQAGQVSSGGGTLANGNFESGRTDWVSSTTSGDVIIVNLPSSAHAGGWYAWFGAYVSSTDTLYQDVTIPGGQPRLQFWYRIDTRETIPGAWDTLTLVVADPSTGATLATIATLSNQNATSGWTQSPAYDLSAFAGQRVRLRFTGSNDFSDITDFRIDDVTLSGSGGGAANSTALWYKPGEDGWGMNVNQQGDIVFATLFTYDASNNPLWFFMSRGDRQGGSETFSGTLYRATGPAFDAVPFTPITLANLTQVGTMTIAFSGDSATLTYTVSGTTVVKQIVKQVFGARAAVCATTAGSRAGATNYQDLWYKPGEDGWGINLTQQGNTMFATLFTYASDGQPLWLFMSGGTRQSDGAFLGTLYRATGPVFNAQPFTPITLANLTEVGTMRLAFSDGQNGTLTYNVGASTVVKAITRQVFASPLPLCES